MPLRLAVLASGRGSNLQAIMDAINNGMLDAEITVVASDKRDAYALERARQQGIPAVHINPKEFSCREDYEVELLSAIKEYGYDLICLAGYMRILGSNLIRHAEADIVNIHPSLLPSFPGLHAQKQAFDYGVKFSGCTVHFVDEGLDSGPIILQRVVPVLESDTVEDLSQRILVEEHQIYIEAIGLIAANRAKVEGRRVIIQEEK